MLAVAPVPVEVSAASIGMVQDLLDVFARAQVRNLQGPTLLLVCPHIARSVAAQRSATLQRACAFILCELL